MKLCPYCAAREADSDDHIFPRFLGGRETIPACRECNSTFGRTFEGILSKEMAPLWVAISGFGVNPPGSPIWKRAFKHDGHDYNMAPGRGPFLSKPIPKFNEEGEFIGGKFPLGHPIMSKPGFKWIANEEIINLDDISSKMEMTIGPNLYRLAMKICVALANYKETASISLSNEAKALLLEGDNKAGAALPDPRTHAFIEERSSFLGHAAYVHFDNANKCIYGIVQIFKFFQIHTKLSNNYQGPQFAKFASMRISSLEEKLALIKPQAIENLTPLLLTEYNAMVANWAARFNFHMSRLIPGRTFSLHITPTQFHTIPETNIVVPGDIYAVMQSTLAPILCKIFCKTHQLPPSISPNYSSKDNQVTTSIHCCCSTLRQQVEEAIQRYDTAAGSASDPRSL